MTQNNESDTLLVSQEDADKRLDLFLTQNAVEYSRSYFQNLIKEGLVLVNGEQQKKRYQVQVGDEIEVEFALTEEISLTPEPIDFEILYEDEALIAINKPAGLVVHPAPGHRSKTFVNGLLYHCKELPNTASLRPGIVHRLDKETSGVLIAAKTKLAHEKLVSAFAKREIEKTYLAICIGNPGNRTIENPIGRHPIRRKEMSISPKGREALTKVHTLETEALLSAVRLYPTTGRTHQLRVHLKSVNAPILGDKTYGNKAFNQKFKVKRQLLHAHTLSFIHPITGQKLEIKGPIPNDMDTFLKQILKMRYETLITAS